jgi:hypothetical protein
MIAYELDIWRDDTFNITYRIEFSHLGSLGELRWLRNVLLDNSLVRCLSRRTRWRFDSIEVVFAILMSIPEVYHRKTRKNLCCRSLASENQGPDPHQP